MVFPMESVPLTSKLMTSLLYNSLKSGNVEGLVAHIEIIIIMCKQELSQKLSIGPIRYLSWVAGKPQTSEGYAVMIRIIENLNNSATDVPTKCDSDVIFCLQLLSKTSKCTPHLC